jgi:hypothetical protein
MSDVQIPLNSITDAAADLRLLYNHVSGLKMYAETSAIKDTKGDFADSVGDLYAQYSDLLTYVVKTIDGTRKLFLKTGKAFKDADDAAAKSIANGAYKNYYPS